MRTLANNTLVGGFLLAPLFVFAQTATTTAEQPDQALINLQQQTDQLVQDRMNLIPKVEDIRANALSTYLDIKTVPQNPGPLETVQVAIQSYLADLNKATISWSLNGKVIDQGVGRTSFSFQNGPSGKTTRLSISVTTNTGEHFSKNLSWNPVGLTILWEADTYTPPFYRGKALLTSQATVRTVAIPDTTSGSNALNAGNLVYTWEKNGSVVPNASGYGKNYFSFSAPKPYEDANVKVRASSVDEITNSETQIKLPLSRPFILFYEKHPLLGVWYNRPFGTDITLNRTEFSISAEPYFFSNESSDTPTLAYGWTVNGKPAQNYGHTITLKNDSGVQGDSLISLAMHGLKQTFQSAEQNLKVHFVGGETAARPAF